MPSYRRPSSLFVLLLALVGLMVATLSAQAARPSAPTSAVVTPVNPTALSDLQVSASGGVDADGDVVSYAYQWQIKPTSGTWTDLTGETTSTLSHPLVRDMQYRVRVWSVAGFPPLSSASPMNSNAVTVLNTPPSAPASVVISPASPTVKTDLTAVYGPATDADAGDNLTYVVQWSQSADGGFTWGAWGADLPVLPKAMLLRGQTWRVRVAASDGTAFGNWRTSATVVIGNSLPVFSGKPVILPSNPTSSSDLSVGPLSGTDADGDVVTFKYQWARFPVGGTAWDPWQDGTSLLSHTNVLRGEQWKVRVAPFDGIDYGVWSAESLPVTIGNSLPLAPTSVAFDPTAPVTGQAVTATATGAMDADNDTLTYEYRWWRSADGVAPFTLTSYATAVLPAGVVASGEQWKVETWADDPYGNGLHFTSAALPIGNAPPSAPTVTLSPSAPISKDNLQAAASGAIDPEGVTALTYEYRWLSSSDGGATWTIVANPGGATLAAANITRGQMWEAQARASDGFALGPWGTSNTVTIGNTTPDLSKVKMGILPTKPNFHDTLQAWASGATDLDGDAVVYRFEWSSSSDQGKTWTAWGHLGQRLRHVTLLPKQMWKIRVRGGDGIGWSTWKIGRPVTVDGSAPTAPAQVLISPAKPTSSQDLTVEASGSTDADNDPVTYFYQWAFSGNGGATWSTWRNNSATLSNAVIKRNQVWKARARAWDGSLYSPWVESAPVVILNSPPTAPVVNVTPALPGPTVDLTATAQSTDKDGDKITYEYQWSRSTTGGTTWGTWDWTGPVLSKDVTELHDQWRMEARATDGKSASDWTISNPVTILGMFAAQDPLPNAISGPRDYISLTFRNPVQQASAEAAFSLTGSGAAVSGKFVWTTPNVQVRFVPTVPLDKAAIYTVTMASGVALVGGGSYDWTESFSFTTSSAPVVVSGAPVGTHVPVTSVITVTFDQNMQRATTVPAFSISPAVDGTTSLVGRVLTFTPKTSLTAGVRYTVTIAATARGTNTLRMHDAYSWKFTTQTVPQPAAGMSAAAAATATGAQITVNLSAAAEVSVVICNVSGRLVAQLPARPLPAGVSTLLWNGKSVSGTAVPSGVYLLHVEGLQAGGTRSTCLTTLRR